MEIMKRAQALEFREIVEDGRRASLSFASEKPVNRWYGPEILCLDAECVNLERLQEIGTALFNHDRDYVIGRIENARLDSENRKAYFYIDDNGNMFVRDRPPTHPFSASRPLSTHASPR